MKNMQIEGKSYEMPPRDGFTITLFITVADINRSADFYEKVFGGRVLSRGARVRLGIFRSRIRGSLGTSAADPPRTSQR